jgi:hypothetical protein
MAIELIKWPSLPKLAVTALLFYDYFVPGTNTTIDSKIALPAFPAE